MFFLQFALCLFIVKFFYLLWLSLGYYANTSPLKGKLVTVLIDDPVNRFISGMINILFLTGSTIVVFFA